MPYAKRTPPSADPTRVGLYIAFCGTITLLVLYENYQDLARALVAFGAAYVIFRLEDNERGQQPSPGS